jgi:hypothetical protein
MVPPKGKARKIAEALLGKPERTTANVQKEPITTGQQAEQQNDNMWRNQVQTTLHN